MVQSSNQHSNNISRFENRSYIVKGSMSLIFNEVFLVILIIIVGATDPNLENHVLPLHGNASLGYYYANMYIGNPGQQQSVIVDTGSGQLALPCSKCISCGRQHIHLPFDVTRSSTSKFVTCESDNELCKSSCGSRKNNDPCTFGIAYAEGSSLNGILIEDDIKFQRDSEGESIRTTFGCTTRETNLFYTQAANGIFGLAPQRNAKLLEQLYQKHSQITGEGFQFSLCLAKNGGHMAIGRSNRQIHKQGQIPVKTSFMDSRNLYSLNDVGAITINQTVIRQSTDNLGFYGIFIDSGATFTYFPRTYYERILVQLENSCAYHSEKCMLARGSATGTCFRIEPEVGKKIKDAVAIIFPSLDIQINGIIVEWPAQKYFLLRSLQNRQVCLGIQSLDRFLLGANWMVDRDITFNLKQRTIQIYSNSNCVLKDDVSKEEKSQRALKVSQTDKINKENSEGTFEETLNAVQTNQQVYQQKNQEKTQEISQQLPPYIGGNNNEPLNYISAALRQNKQLYSSLFLLVIIIIILLVLLFVVGKCFKSVTNNSSKQEQKKGIPQEQIDSIKYTSSMMSERTSHQQKQLEQSAQKTQEEIIHIEYTQDHRR